MIGIYRLGSLMNGAAGELSGTRATVTFALGAAREAEAALGGVTVATGLAGGKFENLNRLLAGGRAGGGWTLVVDDDVSLPHGFLDRLLGVCTAFAPDLAQPAQTLLSHSAWKGTRRRPASLVRQTRFVEIGPVTAWATGRRRAAALPRAALRLGARPAPGGAGGRARLAPRRGRRRAGAPRGLSRRSGVPA